MLGGYNTNILLRKIYHKLNDKLYPTTLYRSLNWIFKGMIAILGTGAIVVFVRLIMKIF